MARRLSYFRGDFLYRLCRQGKYAGGSHGGGGCDIENLNLYGKKIRIKAVLDGDEWVLNGQKRWPSNSGAADLYCVVCTTDPELGDEGVDLIYVPKDTPGISFGKNENKAGMGADKNHLHSL